MATNPFTMMAELAAKGGLALGEQFPNAGTYVRNNLLTSTPAQVGMALAGMSPEQRAAEIAKLQEENKSIREGFSKTPVGQAAAVLAGDSAAKPKPTPPVIPTPPAVDKPEGKPPAPAVAAADKRVIMRQPDGTWTYEATKDRTPDELAAAYQGGVSTYRQENSPTSLKAREQQLAAEAADKIERTTSPSTGYWPGGREGRTGSPLSVGDAGQGSVGDAQVRRGGGEGAFSYMGTPDFSLDKKYSDTEYANLHPAEREEIDKIESAVAARNMRDVEVRKARALAEQDSDPVGYRQRQVEQYMSSARQQLGDPKSFLHTQYQMNMRDFIAKNPKASPEDIQNFAMFLQNKLITQQAEADAARYGQWIAAQDPRVLSSAARNPFAGMFGGGAGAGGTPTP